MRTTKVSLCGQRRLWSDWADAQADLNLHWAHMPFCKFCHTLLKLYFTKNDQNSIFTLCIGSDRPEQTVQNATTDLGLHCLPLIHQLLDTFTDSKCLPWTDLTCCSRQDIQTSYTFFLARTQTMRNHFMTTTYFSRRCDVATSSDNLSV